MWMKIKVSLVIEINQDQFIEKSKTTPPINTKQLTPILENLINKKNGFVDQCRKIKVLPIKCSISRSLIDAFQGTNQKAKLK